MSGRGLFCSPHAIELKKRKDRSSGARRINLMAPLKSAAPFLLRKIGLCIPVTSPTFFGRRMKVVIPEMVSVAIWRDGYFEEDVCTYLLALLGPGDGFIDIGGHFGFFSMLARELVGEQGTVVTFEPMPSTRKLLLENMNDHAIHTKLHVIPAAAGATPGKLKFKDFGLTGSAFATSQTQRNTTVKLRGEVDVEVRTVDSVVEDLGITSLQLIKIDAENAEYDVVQGSLQTLRRLRPSIILEAGDIGDGDTETRRVVDLVMSQGYEPFEFRDWSLCPHKVTQHYGYQNLLMIPIEKAREMLATA